MRDPSGVLVGVEVKVRSGRRVGVAAESIDRRRVARLRGALGLFVLEAPRGHAGIRLDLVTVTPVEDGRWRLLRLPAIDAW